MPYISFGKILRQLEPLENPNAPLAQSKKQDKLECAAYYILTIINNINSLILLVDQFFECCFFALSLGPFVR